MLRAAVRAQPAGWEGVGIERPRTAAEPSKRARIGTSRAAARWRIAAASDDNAEDDVGDERELEALDALLDAEEEDGSGSLEASLSMDQDANPLPQNEGAVEGVKSVDDADAEEDEEEEAYNTHGDEAEHTQRSDHDEGIDVPEVDESMRLSELLHAAGEALMETHRVGPPADRTEIVGLTHDSRVMIPGDVFVCIPGIVFDGHKFAEKAVECGATAIVAENEIRRVEKQGTVPIIYVQDARHALTVLADAFYRMPSHSLECVGITGTNGKTTTSYLVKAVLEEAGHEVGISSTIAQEVGDMKMTPQGERWEPAEEDIDPDRQITAPGALAPHYGRYTKPAVTTPDALNIQQLLNGMLSEGATAAVLETSSHALQQGRVHRVHFDTCVLTNITHDHLDYHGSFAAYKRAKMRLFEKLPLEDKLADREKANLRTVQYEERVPKSDGIHLLEELKEKLVDTDGGFERSDTIVSKRSSSIKPRTTNAASPEDSLRNESSRFSQIGDSAGKQDQLKEAGWTSDDSPMQPYRDTDNIDKRHRHDDQSITETTKDPGQPGESSEGWNELSVSSNAEDAIDQEFSEDALQVGSRYPPRRAVINADDTDAEDFINAAYPVESITYSRDPLRDDVDVVAEDVQCSLFETELDVRTPQGNVNILTPLIGEPNVQNILAAVATGIARDIPLETVKAGIESVVGVPGRLELIDLGQPYAVIVDYAHTPDALDSLLQTVQDVGAKRIITGMLYCVTCFILASAALDDNVCVPTV